LIAEPWLVDQTVAVVVDEIADFRLRGVLTNFVIAAVGTQ
jgi:hypothetical protein